MWWTNHFWILFDGIGTALVISVGGYFVNRFFKERAGTRLKTSVATSGAGNVGVGNINNSGILQIGGNPQPPPSPVGRPLPKIKQTRCGAVRLGVKNGCLGEAPEGKPALVIKFENEAGIAPNVGGEVRAKIIYQDGEEVEVLSVIGCWVNEPTNFTRLDVDHSRKLIVGFSDGKEFSVPELFGSRVEFHRVPPFEIVKVRLTDANHGEILFEGRFDVRLAPLKMTPLSSLRME